MLPPNQSFWTRKMARTFLCMVVFCFVSSLFCPHVSHFICFHSLSQIVSADQQNGPSDKPWMNLHNIFFGYTAVWSKNRCANPWRRHGGEHTMHIRWCQSLCIAMHNVCIANVGRNKIQREKKKMKFVHLSLFYWSYMYESRLSNSISFASHFKFPQFQYR